MKQKYQVTLLNPTKTYRPISCIVEWEQADNKDLSTDKIERKKIEHKGLIKICQKRLWTSAELKKYQYTKVKIRMYDEEKIKKENEERYAKIKEEKYASGEWKKPIDKMNKL